MKMFGKCKLVILNDVFVDVPSIKSRKSHSFWADLHGTIFVACDKLTTGLQLVYDCRVRQRKCRGILKHVLKRCDNRKSCRKPVVSLSHAPKSHRVNRS